MAKEANYLRSALERLDPLSDEPLNESRNDEDPLVELARIVSGGPLYPKPDADAAAERDDNPYAPGGRPLADRQAETAAPADEMLADRREVPAYPADEDVFAGDVTAGLEQELYAELAPADDAGPFARIDAAEADPDPITVAPFEEFAAEEAVVDEAPIDEAPGEALPENTVANGAAPSGPTAITFVAAGLEPAEDEADLAMPAEPARSEGVPDEPEIEVGEATAEHVGHDASPLLDDDRFPVDETPTPMPGGSASLLSQLRRNFTDDTSAAAREAGVGLEETVDIPSEPAAEPYEAAESIDSGQTDDHQPIFEETLPASYEAELEQALLGEIAVEPAAEQVTGEPEFDAPAQIVETPDFTDDVIDDPIAAALAEAVGDAVSGETGYSVDPMAGDGPFDTGDAASQGDHVDSDTEAAPVFSVPVYQDDPVEDATLDAAAEPRSVESAEPEASYYQDDSHEREWHADETNFDDDGAAPVEPDDGFHAAEDANIDAAVDGRHFDEEAIEPPRVAVDLDEAYRSQHHAAVETEYADYDAEPERPYDDAYGSEADGYRDDEAIAVAAYEAEPEFSDDDMLPPHPAEELAASPAEPRSARGLYAAAVLAGVVVVGFGGFFGYKYFAGDASSGPPPMIAADKNPVKITPDNSQKTADTTRSKLIYDRVGGGSDGAEERLVVRSEKPVETLATQNTGSGGSAIAGASGSESAEKPALPRRVRTVVVRPDGTIIRETPPAAGAAGQKVDTVAIRPTTSDVTSTDTSPASGSSSTATADTEAADVAGTSGAAGAASGLLIPRPKPDLRVAAAPAADTVAAPSSAVEDTAATAAPATGDGDGDGETATAPDAAATQGTSDTAAPATPKAPAASTVKAGGKTAAPTKTATRKTATATRKVKTKPIRATPKKAPVPAARPAAPATTTAAVQPAPSAPRPVVTQPIETPQSIRPATPSGTPRAVSGSGPLNLTSRRNAAAPAPRQPTAQAPSAGTYSVQLSSQRSEALAQDAYRSLQRRYPDLLASRNAIIMRADLGTKGTYYRVRVGPMAKGDAGSFCGNLKKRGGDCFIRRN